ncbi:MAG: hypothetical protein A2148_07800 [Chloroflexi bacterium RBG_16_68_14]|nr:MAG: hypothetical protein A2148_07800 [Chloroflexi bacterium RBG_16_68_14]
MDAAWLNRAGILAEAVSFLLIAPEIIGLERLRRIETQMEEWGKRNLSTRWPLWEGGSIVPFLPGFSSSARESIIVDATFFLIMPFLTLGLVIGLVAISDTAREVGLLSLLAYTVSLAAGLISVEVVRRSRSNAIVRWIGYSIGVLAIPGAFVLVVLSTGVFSLTIRAVSRSIRILAGEDRLRALVFGTGLMLLFGGMAAQFMATF